MKLLLLGGTGFVGRHLVEYALERNHEVTLFNRGLSGRELFPNIETIIGDREKSHEALKGRTFDAVVDTNAKSPKVARAAATLFKSQAKHYTFISSMSVYKSLTDGEINESSSVSELNLDDLEDTTSRTFGARKALCERWIHDEVGEKLLVLRPGLIVGPHDVSDRFTYWPVRIAHGGDIIAPSDGSDAVRFIDVRDFASWTIRMIEAAECGVFNAVGPTAPLTMKRFLEECVRTCNPSSKLLWTPTDLLEKHGISAWTDIPVWMPGLSQISIIKAEAAGLTFTPLHQTILDTLAWANEAQKKLPLKAGMTLEREAEFLEKLR
jgi:2'-hydroxyisoflavone reductase